MFNLFSRPKSPSLYLETWYNYFESLLGRETENLNPGSLSNILGYNPPGFSDRSWETKNLAYLGDPEIARLRKKLKDQITKLLGLPNASSASFLANGSMSNAAAVKLARKNRKDIDNPVVIATRQAHISLAQACDCIAQVQSVQVSALEDYQPDEEEILKKLKNPNVVMLHLTAGTTDLGVVEIVSDKVLQFCKEHNIWVHVDASYGGLNIGMLSEDSDGKRNLVNLLKNPNVSSVVIDFHKFVGPYTCSILLFPDQSPVANIPYFNGDALGGTTVQASGAYVDSRILEKFGTEGAQFLVENNYLNAKYLAKCLETYGIRTISDIRCGMCPIEAKDEKEALAWRDNLETYFKIRVAKIKLDTKEGTKHGLRVVFNPNVFYSDAASKTLARILHESRKMISEKIVNPNSDEIRELRFGIAKAAGGFSLLNDNKYVGVTPDGKGGLQVKGANLQFMSVLGYLKYIFQTPRTAIAMLAPAILAFGMGFNYANNDAKKSLQEKSDHQLTEVANRTAINLRGYDVQAKLASELSISADGKTFAYFEIEKGKVLDEDGFVRHSGDTVKIRVSNEAGLLRNNGMLHLQNTSACKFEGAKGAVWVRCNTAPPEIT